jgi:transglutaminase-like putative cysteine protease
MVQCAGCPPISLSFIPAGPDGIDATLVTYMVPLVRKFRRHPLIRQLAVEIRQAMRIPGKDFLGEMKAIHRFVRDYITYVRDVRNVETLQEPPLTLSNRAGDCDDQALLVASLLESIGAPTRFVAMGFDPARPDHYSHVLAEAQYNNRWIPIETTLERPVGWSPPNQVVRMIRNV